MAQLRRNSVASHSRPPAPPHALARRIVVSSDSNDSRSLSSSNPTSSASGSSLSIPEPAGPRLRSQGPVPVEDPVPDQGIRLPPEDQDPGPAQGPVPAPAQDQGPVPAPAHDQDQDQGPVPAQDQDQGPLARLPGRWFIPEPLRPLSEAEADELCLQLANFPPPTRVLSASLSKRFARKAGLLANQFCNVPVSTTYSYCSAYRLWQSLLPLPGTELRDVANRIGLYPDVPSPENYPDGAARPEANGEIEPPSYEGSPCRAPE